MRISKDLSARTPGEELWLARKAAGKTSREAASEAGIGWNRYASIELDRNPPPAPLKTGLRRVSRPPLALLIALARRRSGFGLDGVARRAGTSKVTVHARERSGSPEMVAFWVARGFRFPKESA